MNPIVIVVLKALVGGSIVVVFSAIGEFLRPRGFAGIFAAAPSVALASLAITLIVTGPQSAAHQLIAMVAGAAALMVYCLVGAESVKRFGAPKGAITAMVAWFGAAIGLWAVVLR